MTPADGGAAGVSPTYAIADDLSGVVETLDGFGIFATRADALDALIRRLQARQIEVALLLSKARNARRRIKP